MNRHMQWVWAAALLLSPLAAAAQPAAAPKASSAPGASPAVAAAPAADDEDLMMWFEAMFGPGENLALTDGPGEGPLAFDAPDGTDDGPLAFDAPDGPGGPDGPDGPGGADAPMWQDDGGGGGGRYPQRMNWHGGRAMMMRRGLGLRFAALDLTDAQRDKLRDIHEAAARKNVQRRADMQLAHMDLRKLMRAESPSSSAVNAQIEKISRLQADGMKARFDTFMQVRAVLTPEQLKQLRSGPPANRARQGHDGPDSD